MKKDPSCMFEQEKPPTFTFTCCYQKVLVEYVLNREDLFSGGDECSFKGTTRLELLRNEIKQNSLSYTAFGPQNLWPSVSNYVLTIVSPKSSHKLPVMFMYFLDSGGGSYPEVISSIQSEWFHNKSQELNPQSSVPEIVFWHIPSKAYEKVAKKTVLRQTRCVGSMFEERVAAQEAEMGMMRLLKERHSIKVRILLENVLHLEKPLISLLAKMIDYLLFDVGYKLGMFCFHGGKAVFVGHNHGLDWCCPYDKMWLCYARHSGYGGYGSWARGARILEISDEPFSLKSWIRMENGTLHSEVVLSV